MPKKPPATRLSRRRFLRGATATAATVPFLRSFEVSAQDGPKPKLIIFASGSAALVGPTGGSGYQGWLPSALHGGSGFAERAMSAGALPPILEPLTRHADNVIAIDGLHGSDGVGPHQHAPVLLTGGGINNGERPRSAGGDGEFHADTRSIDHAIAEAIDSRVLGMAYNIDGFQRGEGFLSHTAAGRPFIPIQNPVEAFERVFGSGSSSMGSGTLLARRQSVLDALRDDVRSLQRRLPGADRASLEQHLTSIRAIESDLVAPPSVSCETGTRPDGFDARNSGNFPRLMRSYIQTLVQGLRCGYTRIGFLQAGNLEGSMRPQWDEFGVRTSYNEHAINHKFVGESGAGSDGLSRADAIRLGVNLNRAYNSLQADLLDALAETPDVDGSPMLDHTMVLQVKPMGRNHDSRHLFWTLAGGSALGIRSGRFLRLDRGGNKHYINDLLVAIAQKMGATEIRSFGRGSQNRTPLALG